MLLDHPSSFLALERIEQIATDHNQQRNLGLHIFIDGNDNFAVFHASKMLDGP